MLSYTRVPCEGSFASDRNTLNYLVLRHYSSDAEPRLFAAEVRKPVYGNITPMVSRDVCVIEIVSILMKLRRCSMANQQPSDERRFGRDGVIGKLWYSWVLFSDWSLIQRQHRFGWRQMFFYFSPPRQLLEKNGLLRQTKAHFEADSLADGGAAWPSPAMAMAMSSSVRASCLRHRLSRRSRSRAYCLLPPSSLWVVAYGRAAARLRGCACDLTHPRHMSESRPLHGNAGLGNDRCQEENLLAVVVSRKTPSSMASTAEVATNTDDQPITASVQPRRACAYVTGTANDRTHGQAIEIVDHDSMRMTETVRSTDLKPWCELRFGKKRTTGSGSGSGSGDSASVPLSPFDFDRTPNVRPLPRSVFIIVEDRGVDAFTQSLIRSARVRTGRSRRCLSCRTAVVGFASLRAGGRRVNCRSGCWAVAVLSDTRPDGPRCVFTVCLNL
ncbi:unnamed protein product [Soboliphyme baturini]|uniref:Uncharacterized protein n=1 Tax=Soboliphyme baturini TaxID=241478 RepID=A0A183INA5_9BILA|nr:unnamed protein product [Soboliphyme baturini]